MEKALPAIPAKRYFTIGEVSELCGVKPYVLRYWEQEFTQLKPMKRRGNRRYYQHHEVLLIRRIRDLLYDQGFTISGARNQLNEGLPPAGPVDRGVIERGVDPAGTDDVHADPGAGVVDRHLPREHHHPALAGAVGGDPGLCDDPGGRGHVDDRPGAVREHDRHDVPGGEEWAAQVRGDRPIPVLEGRLGHRSGRQDARAREEDVDASVDGDHGVRQVANARVRRDIDTMGRQAVHLSLAETGRDVLE